MMKYFDEFEKNLPDVNSTDKDRIKCILHNTLIIALTVKDSLIAEAPIFQYPGQNNTDFIAAGLLIRL